MKFYDKYILPKLTHWVCSQNDITRVREKIVPLAKGRILEVGIGSGLNLPFYDPVKVDHVWGLDPSIELQTMARKRAAQTPFEVDFIGLSGEDIPLENNSMDTVLVTYTLCSIPDVLKALTEMNRVIKPGGELIFYEHGRTPDDYINRWQDKINPAWTKISGGCNLNRPISNLIEEGGFKILNLDAEYNSPLKVIGFNYSGIAVSA
jgi:ubiquinone/menaquinone biosynthesis C-methylase UbiE